MHENDCKYIMIDNRDHEANKDSATKLDVVRDWAKRQVESQADANLGLIVLRVGDAGDEVDILWHYSRVVNEEGRVSVVSQHEPGAPHIY